jgi:hypothetical protein
MSIPPRPITLRDKYRDRAESDDFALIDIEDAIQDGANTAKDSVESQDRSIKPQNEGIPDSQFFDLDKIGERKKRSSTDPGAFKQS